MPASSSPAMPRSTASQPASRERARSMGRLESRIRPGASGSGSSTATSSSPVESTPTRARRVTRTRATPMLASTPRWAGPEQRPGREHRRAGDQVAARRPHMVAGRGDGPHQHAVAVAGGAFHHHDRVGAGRDRRAGHDPDRLARPDRPVGRPAGGQVAHHPQPHRRLEGRADGVGGLQRVAVHGRVGERRDRLLAADLLGQRQPVRGGERDRHRLEGSDRGQDLLLHHSQGLEAHRRPWRRTSSARMPASSGPRSGRSRASSMLARRKSSLRPTS